MVGFKVESKTVSFYERQELCLEKTSMCRTDSVQMCSGIVMHVVITQIPIFVYFALRRVGFLEDPSAQIIGWIISHVCLQLNQILDPLMLFYFKPEFRPSCCRNEPKLQRQNAIYSENDETIQRRLPEKNLKVHFP